MDIAILLQMSGIINACSTRYEANVPNTPVSYAKQVKGKLVNIKCHALQVKARGKHKNHLHRSFWLIYELDIDRIIRRISRHNAEMAKRVKEIALTPQDVDIIIRRATFQSLRLQLIPQPFYISGNGKAEH